jgi:hypothetical protein
MSRRKTETPVSPFKDGQRVKFKTAASMELEGKITFIGWILFPGMWSFEVTTDDGQVYKTHGSQLPGAAIRKLEAIEEPAPIFEKTAAGDQAVIPGAEARQIPTTKLQPKKRQCESLTALEAGAIDDKQQSLF